MILMADCMMVLQTMEVHHPLLSALLGEHNIDTAIKINRYENEGKEGMSAGTFSLFYLIALDQDVQMLCQQHNTFLVNHWLQFGIK
jgi:hypothetical protein